MREPNSKLEALPTLPLPFYDQKVVIQFYKAAALKCRTQHKEWILEPKETIAKYVKALGSESPDWCIMRYSHEIKGELYEIFRCRIALPLQPPVTIDGDSLLAKRADMTAALHALLYLLSKDLITKDGLPNFPRSPPRSTTHSKSSSSAASSSSGTSVTPAEASNNCSMPVGETSAASTFMDASVNRSKDKTSTARSDSNSFDTEVHVHPPAAFRGLPTFNTSSRSGSILPSRSASLTDSKEHSKESSRRGSSSVTGQDAADDTVSAPKVQESGYMSPLRNSIASSGQCSPPIAGPSRVRSPAGSPRIGVHSSPPASAAVPAVQPEPSSGAPQRHQISLELARGFIDFYCSKYNFSRADIVYNSKSKATTIIEAIMFIDGHRVGAATGSNMKEASSLCYIDACMWMSSCDDTLWYQYLALDAAHKTKETRATQLKNQQKTDYVPSIELEFSDKLDAQLRSIIWKSRNSELHSQALKSRARAEAEVQRFKKEREKAAAALVSKGAAKQNNTSNNGYTDSYSYVDPMKADALANKSRELQDRHDRYQSDPRQAKMRETRASLPISNYARDLMKEIEGNPVVVVMAQTGSGKTTQLPQIILDYHIAKGIGASCNVICTQPRRLAAISVAQRVAPERGEPVGRSVGYHVRFENSFPERDGSIMFMTSGIFLKRMQVGLEDLSSGKSSFLDEVSHIIVDEVHERDIDVDLLLFTLRRQLIERRKAGKPEFKVVLMSATIDPTLFRDYFPDPKTNKSAPYLEIPGRTYPVKKYYLNEIYSNLQRHHLYQQFRWVLEEKEVKPYLLRELQNPLEPSAASRTDDDLKFPAQLVALIVAFVAQRTSSTRDGHILVFLPGLEEIKGVQKALLDANRPLLNVNFDQYELHILHSEVPIAEQQLVFAPAPRGLQRIILATNIAETSVTIPDVVYVVDAGKCKEKRFDPERHLSSLVQAFTGLGNMGQRAGRAGRHRPGEYFSLVSESRLACLPQNQTVEMKRLDLSNVVMHVKGLNLPMEVEDVLDECIEPPGRSRVVAAINTLTRVGALDTNKNLTSLGKVLLHLPVEAAIGKLCLLGCFFRCLDQVLAIAALLTNRDPFVAPIDKRFEANLAKKRFCPPGFTSDTLTSLKAYNEWASMPNFYDQRAFCDENFLSHGDLRTIEKLRTSLIQSLDKAGVLSLAAGGNRLELQKNRDGLPVLPHFLNSNGGNLPLLAALISCAVAPGFAVRKGPSLLRTPQDTSAMLHASSIATIIKRKLPSTSGYAKEIFAYTEAVKNVSKGGAGQTTGLKMNSQLRGVTLLDPLGLLLFGVHELAIARDGFLCDGWLPMAGKVDLLDDLQRFKDVLHASLLRAFEGLGAAMLARSKSSYSRGKSNEYTATDEYEDDPEDNGALTPLSEQELDDLDQLAKNVVETLQQHAVDNGLPPTYDLARVYSSEDDYIARQYPVRKSFETDKGKVAKREPASYGEWDAWGSLVPTQISNGIPEQKTAQNTAQKTEQTEASAWGAPSASASTPDTVERESVQREDTRSAGDGWGAWQPKTEENDAHDRRASMRRASSTTSSTFTVPRPTSPPATKAKGQEASQPPSSASRNHLSPPPKVNGWIGSQNIDALRSSQQDGWKDYQDKGPTVVMSKRLDDKDRLPPMTPRRQPATYVDVPTSSGRPEYAAGDTSAHTTGWGPFDKYNPRTRSSENRNGTALVPNFGPSLSYAKSSTPIDEENGFPLLSGAEAPVPFQRNEPKTSLSTGTSWDSWSPARHDDGEAAFRGRMTGQPYTPPVRSTTQAPPGRHDLPFSASAAQQPLDTPPRQIQEYEPAAPERYSLGANVSSAPAPPQTIDNPPLVQDTKSSDDVWATWKADVPAETQGLQNYQRRVAMTRGEQLPESPVTVPRMATRAQQTFSTAPQGSSLPVVNESQPASTAQDDDGWGSYKPSVSAEKDGNLAYERRKAMQAISTPGHRPRNGSISNSFSSTSSTRNSFRVPPNLNAEKSISIVGRAKLETQVREAKEARLASFKEFSDGVSTLSQNFNKLKIAGSAARSVASGSIPAGSQYAAEASPSMFKSKHAPPSTASSAPQNPKLGSYSIPLRQPRIPTGDIDKPLRGFNNFRTHILPHHLTGSDPASSDSGTFISERPVNGLPSHQTNGHINNHPTQIPAGGIGWE